MEELLAGLTQFLSTQEGQKQLEAVQQMLGQSQPEEEKPPSPKPAQDLSPALLQGLGKLMEEMHREDDNIRLLRALEPLLSPKRQKRARQAVALLRLMEALPSLKESGMLGGLLDGF